MCDGTVLLADVYRPDADQPVPGLIAASLYPRQIQDLGLPDDIVEVGPAAINTVHATSRLLVPTLGSLEPTMTLRHTTNSPRGGRGRR